LPGTTGPGNLLPYPAVASPSRVCVLLWTALGAPIAIGAGCKAKTPAITEPFSESFERAELGPSWLDTSSQGRVMDGKLVVSEGRNRPLWLRKRLPPGAVVELDVMSKSPDGDIKIELYGDGESFDPDEGRYDPTGYVFVFGGWQNTASVIGKLGEHDDAVKASKRHPEQAPRVEPGRTYHFTITRKGGDIEWKIDGAPFLAWSDPAPLTGPAHEYLAITNWKVEVVFDNLQIRPAP
jgi:Farnesoic acid 0-methyl transferase